MYGTGIDPSLGTNDCKNGISKNNLKDQYISLIENNIAILSLYILSDICILAQLSLGRWIFEVKDELQSACIHQNISLRVRGKRQTIRLTFTLLI